MIIKRFFAAAALAAAVVGTTASAAPTASLSGTSAGGGLYDWTLSFTPDTAMFTNPANDNPDQGLGGSLAVAFQIEMAVGGLVEDSWDVLTGFEETTSALNPGNNPYEGGDPTDGVRDYLNIPSEIGAGNIDAIFVPLGSTFFTSGGAKNALTFTTNVATVSFGGLISQAGVTDFMIPFTDVDADSGVGITGDLDNSGVVSQADLDLVLLNWGGTNIPAGWVGTPQPDGTISQNELDSVLLNWGSTGLSAVSSVNVPEPTALVMLICGVGVAMVAHRRG